MNGTMTDKLVAGQVNFVDVKTLFDSTWDGLNKSYQFTNNGGKAVELESNDEVIQLPYDATKNAGTMEISVFGTLIDADGETILKKATTNSLRFKVLDSSLDDDPDNIGDVDATVVEQIRQIVEDTDARIDELIEDLENGVYNTGGGTGGGGITKETDPTVPSWAKQKTKPTYTKSEVGLSNVDNVRQYSNNNPPPYPVTSVNGKTGAVNVDVPTKTSQLTNDSKFVTESYVKNEIANAQIGGEGGDIDLSGFATKEELDNKVDKVAGKSLVNDTEISRLKDVKNYDDTEIRNELNNKANKSDIPSVPSKTSELENDSKFATTDYVDNEIATFDFIKVVDSLPTTGLANRIYFVPKNDTDTQDLFDEYAWINDKWEWITTKQIEVDLTDYVKRDELTTLATKEDLKNKQDKLNYNLMTLTQGEYDNLVSSGTIDDNTYYFIKEE